MEEKFTFFWSGPFSQWHMCSFTEPSPGGKYKTIYNCAEQYMMSKKSLLFEDTESYDKIMLSSMPKDQKDLGRVVKNFKEDVWFKHARAIVYQGNYLKFTQNTYLLRELLDTKGTTLVEASPFDTIWGIGMDVHNPNCHNRSKWKGQNWLGQVLTELRDNLILESLG